MLYTNWDERFDPDYDPTLDEEEDYPDDQTVFFMTVQVFIEEIVDILNEMYNSLQHQIDRNQHLK